MCFNSEYINYFFKIVDEIVELYDIDGLYFDELSFQSWCKCENCNTLFRQEYGINIPSNTDDKFIFKRFLDWRYRNINEIKSKKNKKFKKENYCIFFQNAFPLADFKNHKSSLFQINYKNNFYKKRFSDVDWSLPMCLGNNLINVDANSDIIHLELYRRSVMSNMVVWLMS